MIEERRSVTVRGIVQGVGFRPYVYGLARRHALAGFVRNDPSGVRIEIEGDPLEVRRFLEELPRNAPPAARILTIEEADVELNGAPAAVRSDKGFHILRSATSGRTRPLFVADRGTCEECRRELFDPEDRRFGYPFSNCTQCGPRLTIIEGAPYDRERTTMAAFEMCPSCRAEYEDPSDRRFHAQPIACPECGPRLDASLDDFVDAVLSGKVGALKGLGGYHLVCDGTSEPAVLRLRERKARDEKPFAVMVGDLDGATALARLSDRERALLSSPRRPIVLVPKRDRSLLAPAVAPGNPNVGLLLPYTPLHLLLMEKVAARPLVMTSGNRSDEPIVHREDDLAQLEGIADVVLSHNRRIRVRCDDSVTRVVLGEELPLRRSRGYAPEPIHLARAAPKRILAAGGHLKNTFALADGERVFLSHHIGDLDELRAFEAFERDIALYEELFDFEPEAFAHDLHPDYASTRYARERAEREGLPCIAIQHHHAHVAACMAEHGLDAPVIGVAFDGTGFGSDGTIWGGEFLITDYREFRRASHLRAVSLPGGDRAAKETWRMALSYLVDAGIEPTAPRSPVVVDMIKKGVNAPLTSSAGRLFDAVSSLIDLRHRISYEGQAAMELEWLCGGRLSDRGYPFVVDESVDTRPLIRAVQEDVDGGMEPTEIARRFHRTVVSILEAVCERLREAHGLSRVVLSGGVFQNALLTESTVPALERRGFDVYRHRTVPPNDGGISLGQIAIASEQLSCV